LSDIGSVSTQFEPGAPAPEGFIPLCVPEIRGNEWKYIKECLDTRWVSSVGPFVDRFERMVADYVGTKYAVATVNGTAALHIALLVAGVQPDDEVLVSTLTFIAPANAIRYVGAWPVFIDAEPDYWQMDPQKVVDFLEKECEWRNGALHNKTTGRRVKAILPVHILGHPCDIDPILEVARKYTLVVIEDATESLGARYKGRMVGHLGNIACFSFNGNKIITTGGGGMIVTDNEAWAHKARYLTTQAKDDPVEYIHNNIGYNYRLTNIQAAVGCAQMEQLDSYIAAKRRIAATYIGALTRVPGITTICEARWAFSIFWLFTVLVSQSMYGMDSRALMKRLYREGIQTRPLWHPIHGLRPYQNCPAYRIEVADKLYRDGLSLPSSVGLNENDQRTIIQRLKEFCDLL
jgi:perosamine synthetase